MKANITVVKASHLQPFIRFLDEKNLPIDSLLHKVHMQRELFSSAENLVPEAPFWEFLDLIVNELGIIDIGFKVTEQLSLDRFGVFGVQVMHSETLHKALLTFIATMGKQSNCPPFWLVKDDQGIWFYRLGTQGIKRGQWPIEQHVVSLMIQLVRGFTSNEWTPPLVHLQTTTLLGAENNSSFKNSQVFINKTYTGIYIPFDILNNTSLSMDKENLSKAVSNMVIDNIPEINADVIKTLISQSSYTRSLSAVEVAQILAINVRQMQRILKNENVTFRSISKQVLIKEVKTMLRDSDMPIVDIAVEFGYLEPANFTRAFKRLSGLSPSEYRQQFT